MKQNIELGEISVCTLRRLMETNQNIRCYRVSPKYHGNCSVETLCTYVRKVHFASMRKSLRSPRMLQRPSWIHIPAATSLTNPRIISSPSATRLPSRRKSRFKSFLFCIPSSSREMIEIKERFWTNLPEKLSFFGRTTTMENESIISFNSLNGSNINTCTAEMGQNFVQLPDTEYKLCIAIYSQRLFNWQFARKAFIPWMWKIIWLYTTDYDSH